MLISYCDVIFFLFFLIMLYRSCFFFFLFLRVKNGNDEVFVLSEVAE